MDNTIINHDTNIQTLITIKLDNKNINHVALNRFLIELEYLQQKYLMSTSNDGITYVE